jgi:hypothetical protein
MFGSNQPISQTGALYQGLVYTSTSSNVIPMPVYNQNPQSNSNPMLNSQPYGFNHMVNPQSSGFNLASIGISNINSTSISYNQEGSSGLVNNMGGASQNKSFNNAPKNGYSAVVYPMQIISNEGSKHKK